MAPAAQALGLVVIPVYVINLVRSAERRAWMEAELARAGVEGVFVRAVDGRRFGPLCERASAAQTNLSKAELALTLSHRKVWRIFLTSAADVAVILEDDVHLGRGFRQALSIDWRRWDFDIVKLETLFHKVWHSRRGEPAGERTLHRIGAEHLGAAAYIVSRAGARKALAGTRALMEPVDHTLFGRRAIFDNEIKVLQLIPAIAVQDTMHPDAATRREALASTLHEDDRQRLAALRREGKPRGWERLRREAQRLADQLRRWIRLAPSMRRGRIPWE